MLGTDSKRIFKNTLMLYFRMGLILIVSFYTSRVVLEALGVADFGVYNVVGGIVGLFTFINTALSQGSQRFISYYSGQENLEMRSRIFSAALINHVFIAGVVIFVAEIIGLLLLFNKLNIPSDRLTAAFWVFQFSILTSALSIMQVPYNATIIAHERMGFFAFISIIEASLKLIVAFLLSFTNYDLLLLYGFLLLCVQFVITLAYRIFCIKNYKECKFKYNKNFDLNKKLFTFSSYAFLGGMGYSLSQQGGNILLNVFFGPVVNAARGVAVQLANAANQFINNFQLAVNPQLVKNYAAGNKIELINLMFDNIRISLSLCWLIIFPLIMETDYIIKIWLKAPPAYSSIFCKIILAKSFLFCIEQPLNIVNGATGKNKAFNIVSAVMFNLSLPIMYILLKFWHSSPIIVFIIDFFIGIVTIIIKMFFIRRQINLLISDLINKVFFPIGKVIVISAPITLVVFYFINCNIPIKVVCELFVFAFLSGIAIYKYTLSQEIKSTIIKKLNL